MGPGGGLGVVDLDQDAVALVVVVVVLVPLQVVDAADQAADPAARHRLEVGAGAQRLGAQLLGRREQRRRGSAAEWEHRRSTVL